jgi:hypothetical protein
MPIRLKSVLSSRDLPSPELGALVLDGEAYRVDDCVATIDQASGPLIRASALALELPPRLIAEQHTAAWVWGATPLPPARHEVCADITARARPPWDARMNVREVVILHEDITVLAGVSITAPMRTAIDLARFVAEWSDDEARVVAELLAIADRSVLECARAMNRKRNLPNKKIALVRLAECASLMPSSPS